MWLLLLLSALAGDVDDLIHARRYAEALTKVEALLRANPNDLVNQELWIDLLQNTGHPEVARDRYAAALRQRPEDADLFYLAGRASNDADKSRAAYEQALRLQPEHARAWMGLGAVHRAAGDLAGAAAAYQHALQIDTALPEAWNGLLACFLATRDHDGALAVARAATASVPTDPEPWLALSALDTATAGATLRQAVRLIPHDSRVHAAFAEQLVREGDGAGAITEARLALAIDPFNDIARLAVLYGTSMKAGTLDVAGYRALEVLRRSPPDDPAARSKADAAVAAWPASPIPWLLRARFLTGNPTAAAADLRRALQADSSNDEAQAALGQLLYRQGQPAEAAPLLLSASRSRPQDVSLAIAAGRATFDAGDTKGGQALLAEAAARSPDDPVIPIAQAELLLRSGKAEAAWKLLQSAWDRLHDLRLRVALAAAGMEAGHRSEAAEIYDELAALTGNAEYTAAAERARAAP